MSKLVHVDFEPVGRRIDVTSGTNLLEAAQAAGVQLSSLCGGIGSCDTCKIRLVKGQVSKHTLEELAALSEEEIATGYRLACQTVPESDVKVDIPPESLATPQRLQVEGQEIEIELDPIVKQLEIQLEPASLRDLQADDVRLKSAVERAGISSPEIRMPVMRDLSNRLRSQNWDISLALRDTEIVAVLPAGSRLLGLSVDVGTTKVAAYLVDLADGSTLAKVGAMNPQVAYGEDVISRIAYTNQHKNVLHKRIIDTLNNMVDELCQVGGAQREQIVEAVVVGNTAMHHLFLGLPVRQLGESPYVPALGEAVDVLAADIGLKLAPGAYVYLPPNVAGYVGADHVAMVLASGVWNTRKTTLALDIGTNTEITLAAGGRLLSCSTASGPVFEGAHIHDGMRAAPGAIERVQIVDGDIRLQTIDAQPPVGICGSGILDVVAEMLDAGILNRNGRMLMQNPLVHNRDGSPEVTLVATEKTGHNRDIVVNRKDVNEIQLAKGAIRAGSEILLAEAGLSDSDLDEIIIAGAFGTYIHVPSAVRVGMFPPLALERFRQIGNAAGVGAKQMLVSRQRRHLALQISQRIEYIELTIHPRFTEEFMKAMFLKSA
jgi:uncharacterized 2Fe-2S/4Fe-4S cluster protein (DUF4445 family)